MKKSIALIVSLISLFIINIEFSNAQILYYASGAEQQALGNQISNVSNSFSALNNPAGLGYIENFSLGMGTERRFLVAGTDFINVATALPTKTGTFGLGAMFFGNSAFNQKNIALSFGKLFGKKFSVGVKFHYINYFIEENGSRNVFTFDVGFQYKASEKVLLGAQLSNPIPIELESVYGEKVPTIIRFGFSYFPNSKIAAHAEVEKDLIYKPNIKAGVGYKAADFLWLRAGINSYPLRGTFGFGFEIKDQFNINLAASYHPFLGITPQLSLDYIFKKKNKNQSMQ